MGFSGEEIKASDLEGGGVFGGFSSPPEKKHDLTSQECHFFRRPQ